jgi:hypothetical protein
MTSAVTLAQSASTGVSGQFKNRIINGDMRIDQRNTGASITVPTSGFAFPVDRFFVNRANGFSNTASAQQVLDAPAGFFQSLRYTAGTAETPTSAMYSNIQQYIEGQSIADLLWGTANARSVTLTFWVKISITGTFGVVLRSANAGLSYAVSFSYPSANTWQLVTATIPGPTTGVFNRDNTVGFSINWDMGVGPSLSISATGAWQSANALGLTGGTKLTQTTGATYQITGVQLEVGTNASGFDFRPYPVELLLCQRYFARVVAPGQEFYPCMLTGGYIFPSNWYKWITAKLPVTMRTSPSVTFYPNPGSTAEPGRARYFNGNASGAGSNFVVYGTDSSPDYVKFAVYNEHNAITCYGAGAWYDANAEF